MAYRVKVKDVKGGSDRAALPHTLVKEDRCSEVSVDTDICLCILVETKYHGDSGGRETIGVEGVGKIMPFNIVKSLFAVHEKKSRVVVFLLGGKVYGECEGMYVIYGGATGDTACLTCKDEVGKGGDEASTDVKCKEFVGGVEEGNGPPVFKGCTVTLALVDRCNNSFCDVSRYRGGVCVKECEHWEKVREKVCGVCAINVVGETVRPRGLARFEALQEFLDFLLCGRGGKACLLEGCELGKGCKGVFEEERRGVSKRDWVRVMEERGVEGMGSTEHAGGVRVCDACVGVDE